MRAKVEMKLQNKVEALWARAWRFVTRVPVLASVIFAATFLVYWRTTAPTVLPGDSGEFQFAAWGFWLAHPTGYPFYLLLGGIWQHALQYGDPAFRLNLFSAFLSALAVGVAFLVFWQSTRARGAAFIAALTFAVTPLFWSQATRAEVYALHSLLIALLAWFGILWRATTQKKYALAFALTFGLSLAHHRTTILLLPAFAALFADNLITSHFDARHFAKRALWYGALAAIPLLLYLYIPLRAGATPYATIEIGSAAPIGVFENSPRGWLAVLLGSGFANELRVDAATWDALRELPYQWLAQFNPIGVVAALFGFGALLWQKKFSTAAFVLFGILAFVLFNSVYHIGDIADYYTPIYFFGSLAVAACIAFITQQLRAHEFTRYSTLPTIALLAFFAALPLQNLFTNFLDQDRSQHTQTRTQWATLFAMNLPDDAVLLTNDRDEMTPLYFLQLVEKQKQNWRGVFPKIAPGARYANVLTLTQNMLASGRPVYTLKPLPALRLRYRIEEMENGVWHVRPVAPGAPQVSSNAVIGEALRVRGYSIVEGEPYAGERIVLTLQYELLERLARDYTISVQLFDANENKVAQANDHIPGQGEYPPRQWRVGEILQDEFAIELAPNLETANYKIMLRVYDPSSGEELGELTEVAEIMIEE